MIGPLFRSPRRAPRSAPLLFGRRRRVKNAITDLFEMVLAPLGFWRSRRLVVEEIELSIRGLGAAFDGYRIALLTDLHASPLVPRWWLDGAVQKTLALRPDLIALGGDYVDDDAAYIPSLREILRPLRAPDGVVAVLGNHDHYVDAAAVRAALAAAGVRELRNAATTITRGDSRLAIVGVGDLHCDVIDFEAALAGTPGDVPRLVLSHHPDVFAYWPAELRLDLMLAGHTHGGQAYLPLIGPPFVPSQFGFRYLAGHYRDGERQLYVSRGVGVSGVPFRWRCPPELTLVVLRAS